MPSFNAVLIEKTEKAQRAHLTQLDEADLMDGDVDVRVEWSTVNYKDGLALTGKAPVVRRWPMIPGVDLAGTVLASRSPKWKEGDKVILNGWGLGEIHLGAYAELARVKAEWLVPLPKAFSARDAMAIGTAGYTAMLCVLALEDHGVTPDRGEIVVTGASGGVGSVAVALLAKAGFSVTASTGRTAESDYLKSLGAAEVVDRKMFEGPARPLNKERFAGAVDSVGGAPLAQLLTMIKYRGAVAACGLAASMDLPTSVAPFILRGVALLGVDSVHSPIVDRYRAWERLASDLHPDVLKAMTTEIPLADVFSAGARIIDGQVRGRVVVRIA